MALYSSFTFAGDWILFTISRVCRFTFLTALSLMCDSTAYFAVPLLLTPFLTALSLKPRKSEYCLFKLTILDFSGLMSSPSRSFSQSLVAAKSFTASLRLRQKILKSSAYRTM